jgi:hypothetical protein
MELNTHLDGTIADAYYLQLPTGGPTQGDIWINLPSGADLTKLCDGIVITPRCDFAHCKSPVVNYLPIITLEKYILTTACFSLVEQYIVEKRDLLRSKSKGIGLEALFELDVPVSEIIQAASSLEYADNDIPVRLKALREEFNGIALQLLTATELLLEEELTMDQVRAIGTFKKFERLQRDLIRNNSVDTYFLPPCSNLIQSPSIVLLRHIYTCPIEHIDSAGGQRRKKRMNPDAHPPERLLRLNSPFIESSRLCPNWPHYLRESAHVTFPKRRLPRLPCRTPRFHHDMGIRTSRLSLLTYGLIEAAGYCCRDDRITGN